MLGAIIYRDCSGLNMAMGYGSMPRVAFAINCRMLKSFATL